MPVAPGTWGTALAFLLTILLKPDDFTLLMIFIPAFLLGIITSHNAEKMLGKDSIHIVIDEFCGYLLSVAFIPKSTIYLLSGFILFRIFDVIKPPPIRRLEETVPGGAGIMIDDILAAVYTNICMQLWRYFI
ncbi:MAG: phosphatidylglycerophosphatase A [Thermodesulfovibrionia bacterium]|nr:phosphatidylglycerophosphatase A [Thermodesulfovibrionia bacterium]